MTPALPGLGLPLEHYERKAYEDCHSSDPTVRRRYFPNALGPNDILGQGRASMPLLTVREITMLQIMEHITNKRHWYTKVFDDNIVATWRSEITRHPSGDVTPKMMEYLIAELRHAAKEFDRTRAVVVYDLVTYSDHVVSPDFRERFISAVSVLERVPDARKDWHPGSDRKVLDLVHPSLFPLVYGRSRVFLDGELVPLYECVALCGRGDVIPVPPQPQSLPWKDRYSGESFFTRGNYSRKFQWLPCEVDISGRHAKITSYINNLHPARHWELYRLIEHVIDAAIPLWNTTLSAVQQRSTHYSPRIRYEGSSQMSATSNILPEPEPFRPLAGTSHHQEAAVDLKRSYGSSGLQIIVKLANIELTPEKPEYSGGSWHVEGQLNEHICATAIYYYSNENITPSTLAFRQQCNTDAADSAIYPQHYHDWLPLIFGLKKTDPAVQILGGISTTQGRLLTFPNILQHQVQPFQLSDKTKPGHRKILALFLVDPGIKIISTANVPCQRLDWWSDEVDMTARSLNELPVELRDEIFGRVEDFPIGMPEAKSLRLELMEERKHFEIKQNKAFNSVEFSLCEH